MENQIKKAERKIGLYVIGAIIVLIVVFFAGTKFAANSGTPIQANGVRVGMMGGARGFGRGGMGLIAGTVIKKDDQSITLQMQDGSTKIVFVDNSTKISKTVSGSIGDVAIGGIVTVNGTTNSDGSITGQSVQIRSNPNQ